jgi:hypothetical protein
MWPSTIKLGHIRKMVAKCRVNKYEMWCDENQN